MVRSPLLRKTARMTRRRLLLSSTLLPATVAMVGTSTAALAQAVNLGHAGGNSIVPDGRTATSVTVQGTVTSIRTSTFSGGNAYNSFSTFSEAAGNTVNLYVPKKANNLVNIVRNGAVNIQGTLNSYKNGQIGGNVVFADSYGFVVGAKGVVNVGGLTVVTPSGATLDQVIDKNGHVNQALAAQMIAGNVPLSADGSVVIRGQVNAAHFVRITAEDVRVAGSMAEAKRVAMHRAQFEATVNTNGMTEGGAIVVRNGSISIVAANNAAIGGRLAANGTARHGGSVSVAAGHNATIEASARVSASATYASTASRSRHRKVAAMDRAPTITISAADAVTIAGQLSTVSASEGLPGEIGITGADISLSSTAKLVAQGVGAVNGGHISIKSTDATTVAAGASFLADALGTGNGGFVEISGKTDTVSPDIKIDLGAVSGTAGTLLFDPDDLIIGGTAQTPIPGDDATISSTGSLYTNGASVELDANHSITIDGVIDTRQYASETATSPTYVSGLLAANGTASTGNSGSITLNAPTITIATGGALYADVNNVGTTTYTAGTVTLTANTSSYLAIGYATADSEITVNGTIAAASITANAIATAESVYALDANDNSPGAMASVSGLTIGLDLSPLSLTPGYVQSKGIAKVTIGSTADLIATNSGAITLTAHTTDVSSDPALGLSAGGSFLAGGVVVGETAANATVEIENGAQVTGGALTVAATNAATLAIKTTVISGIAGQQGAPIVFTVVYGATDVDANALIDSGAIINISGSGSAVDVLARNDNSFSAGATSYARNGGAAGTAVAISDFDSSAIANVGANLGSAANKIGAVTIVAQDETASNQTSAATTVGAGTLADILSGLSTVGSIVGQGVQSQSFTAPNVGIVSTLFSQTSFGQSLQTGGASLPSVAGSVSLSFGTQTATASISAAVTTGSNGAATGLVSAAPAIYSASSVAVISDVTDAAFLNYAASAVNSPMDGTTLNPSASSALSAAVGYTDITHNSSAVVGPDTSITAAEIGVQATTSIPSPIENVNWTNFYSSSPNSVVGSILANKLLATTATNSTSASSGLGLAGSVNIALFNVNTTAWIGDGATLTTTSAPGTWSAPDLTSLDTTSGLSGYPNSTIQASFTGDVSVYAKSLIETIDAAGNAGLGGNQANGPAAVGVSFGYIDDTTTTIAGLAQGVNVSSDDQSGTYDGEVNVNALTTEHIVDISPTSGSGQGINVSGLVDIFNLNDTTLASISNAAHIQAKAVVINADDDLGVYAIAGDIAFTGTSGVGIAVAYTGLTGDTEAYVGDNSSLFGGSIGSVSLYVPGSPSYTGEIDTGTLDVDAKTSGNDVVAAIVGQVSDSSAPSPPPISAGSAALSILGTAASTVTSNVSITASGASAVTDSAVATKAYLDGANVQNNDSTQTPYLKVDALNDMLTVVGSGGAAITLGGASKQTSGALSGAISVEASINSTLAYITNSAIAYMPSVDVEAATGGLTTVVGLGLSVNTSSNSPTSVSIAGSVSVIKVDDRVAAYIDSSTLSHGGNDGDAIVLADQATELGIGAGAFFLGGKGGFGLTLTYVDVVDPSSGPATDAHISNSSVLGFTDIDVIAESPQIVYSGAATGGTTTSASLGGAFIFNYVDATTSATISNSGSSALSIEASNDVNVIASANPSSIPMDTNATSQTSDSGSASMTSEFAADPNDTSASDQADGALLAGNSAAIVAVAGLVEVGSGNNFGVSSVTNSVDEGHVAGISGVTVSAQDAVTIAANDSTSIVALAVGVGATSGNSAGEAAFVINTIQGGPNAYIGSSVAGDVTTIGGTTSGAYVGAVTIDASDSSAITGIALSTALSDKASDGYAVSSNDIETATTASIVSANITTTSGSSLLPNATGDIIVEGESTGSILSVAVGVAASNKASVGGSSASNVEKSNVATAVENSTLFASNNAAVLASNTNAINAIAGAAGIGLSVAGVGASVTVDQIGGTRKDGAAGGVTTAEIGSSIVDAAANGSDTLQIVNGVLVVGAAQTSVMPGSPSAPVAPGDVPTLGKDVREEHGLAVVAGSSQTSVVDAVTLGISQNVAVAINSVTTTMGGDTEATVTGSSLDTHLNAAAPIDVSARSISYSNDLAVAVAAAYTGALGGAATVVVNTMNRTTNAEISGSSVGTSADPAGAVTVSADAWEATTGESLGAAASDGGSFAGSALVNVFNATTTATVVGGTDYAAALSDLANAEDGYWGAVGAVAGGATAGLGASVLVAILDNTTSATIGDPTSATATTINLMGPLTVSATTTSDTQSYTVGGAVGGTAGVAAMVTVNEETNSTTAQVWDSTVTITGSGDADITATENVDIDALSGGLGGGGTVGVGASINLVILRSNDKSTLDDDTISTPGAVNVETVVTRDVDPITVTAGIGGTAGFAATVGVVLVGEAASSDEIGVLNQGGLLDSASDVSSSSGDLTAAAKLSGTSCSSGLDCMTASIVGGANSSIMAGSVTVSSTSNTDILNVVGSLAVGLTGGVGAAVGYTELDQRIGATTSGGTIITSKLTISASAGDDQSGEADSAGRAARTLAVAGAGGAYVGLGAAVADSIVNDTVTAQIGSNVDDGPSSNPGYVTPSSSVSVTAADTSTALGDAYGAAVGTAAVGASVATAMRSSTVTAEALDTASIGAQTVTIQATESGATYVLGIGGAAGGFAGVGVDGTATDNATVIAEVDDDAAISALGTSSGTGGLTVEASDDPDAKAFAFGVSAGAAAAGVSITDAKATSHVTASISGKANLAQTVNLTVSATCNVTGTLATSFPSSSTVPASTMSFEAGRTTAVAWSIAGSGGVVAAGDATDTTADSTTDVTAETGTGLKLPSGIIAITASNTTNQFAQGDGVTVSGGYAFGAVVVTAESSPVTTAEIGSSTTSTNPAVNASNVVTTIGTEAVTVDATGSDTNNAMALAGAGGTIAGNGAAGLTTDDSSVNASIGDNSNITASSIAVNANHTDTFTEMGDTLNASAVGASAAYSSHDVTSVVNATIGNNVTLDATSAGQVACYNLGCEAAINITAENDYFDASSGTQAAAGGGINGAGAVSSVTIESGSGATITIGTNDHLISGLDPNVAPGSIQFIADTSVTVGDTDTLNTGGVIQGAGVNSSINASLNNTITIDGGAQIATYGTIDAATYTVVDTTSNAYVSTYGVAAVGVADSSIGITSNQAINILSSANSSSPTNLDAFYNINLSAGEYLTAGLQSSFNESSDAQGFVRGLIAIPVANGQSSLTQNASVNIGNGNAAGGDVGIYAGQNVALDAYQSTPMLSATGTAHGFELGFIPVTENDANTPSSGSSGVTVDGTIVAGQYYSQTVTIALGSNGDPTATYSGAPITYTSQAAGTVACSGSGLSGNCILSADNASTAAGLVPSGTTPVLRLGGLFASGGDVTINAGTLAGTGSVTAHGSPSITVSDPVDVTLVIAGGAEIPNMSGGAIVYTGAAGSGAATFSQHPDTIANVIGAITINLTGNDQTGLGAALVIDTPIDNLGGAITIYNARGSLIYQTVYATDANGNVLDGTNGTTATVVSIGATNAAQVNINAPYGALVVNAPTANGAFIAAASPVTEFAGVTIYPGGEYGNATGAQNCTSGCQVDYADASYSGANDAVQYVASSIFQNNLFAVDNVNNTSTGALTTVYGFNTYIDGTFYTSGPTSTQASLNLYGSNNVYNYSTLTNYNLTFTAPASAETTSGSAASSQIYGKLISINAATIDINGKIQAGPPTDYNVTVGSSAAVILASLSQEVKDLHAGNYTYESEDVTTVYNYTDYNTATMLTNAAKTGNSINITSLLTFNSGSATDLQAYYNTSTNQITFSNTPTTTNNINVYSLGASVTLHGNIISSNTLGNVTVASGYGQVSINNQSDASLDINNINTGLNLTQAATTSTVTVWDTLKDAVNGNATNDTTTFVYNPNSGLQTYLTSNGASPFNNAGGIANGATEISSSSSSSGSYNPATGAAYEYVQEADLARNVTSNGPGSWFFTTGTGGDPYEYVPLANVGGTGESSNLTSNPVGGVVIHQLPSGVAYQETIYGNIVVDSQAALYAQSAKTVAPNIFQVANQGFLYRDDTSQGVQHIDVYPLLAFVRLTSIVKADNPIGINFTGNTSGTLTITSPYAAINIDGTVQNPSGTTSISTGGALTQTAAATISGYNLALTANSIGTATQPIMASVTNGTGSSAGSFTATTRSGGIYANLNTGANGFAVNATNGDVVVNATGSLTPGSLIGNFGAGGNNVTINSALGSIGSTSAPLEISTNGVINASAYGDIALFTGNTLVGRIASTSGDIYLYASGSVYDALGQTAASSLSSAQVTALATALHLTGTSDADAGSSAISGFNNLVNSDLSSYAAFVANGTIGTGTITLDGTTETLYATLANSAAIQTARANQATAAQYAPLTIAQIQSSTNALDTANGVFSLSITSANRAGYQAQAAAALGIATASTVTDTQIQAWANSQYQAYATTFIQAYGTNWQAPVAVAAATQAATNAALTGYDSLSSLGTVANGVFALNANAIVTYRVSTAQSLGITPTAAIYNTQATTALGPNATSAQIGVYADNLYQTALAGVTSAQVQAYASGLYSTYASQLQTTYGSSWQTQIAGVTNYSPYTLNPTSALATALTQSANWTQGQIVQAIDLSAIEPTVATVGSSATPDIVGRNVTITTTSPLIGYGGSVGVYNPNTTPIPFSQVVSGTLSAADQAALAVATSPGSVTLVGTDASGNPLTNVTSLTPGSTITSIIVSQTKPLFIDATGTVTIDSKGSAYLQATGASSINVNNVSAGGDVYLASPQSILPAVNNSNVPLSSVQINTPGDLIVEAGGGSIGSSTIPLTYSIGGSLIDGSAGTDSYLYVTGANAFIQRDSAGGTASITTAAGDSILSALGGVNVKAPNIILVSGNTIGTSVSPFEIEGVAAAGGTTGALSGSSVGAANIDAPNVAGSLNSINVSAFNAQSNLTLGAGGLLDVTGLVESSESISVNSGSFGMTTAGQLHAAGTITIDTIGDATIGLILTTYNPTSVSPVVTINAGGSILSATSVITPAEILAGASLPVGATLLPDGTYFTGTPVTVVAEGANGTLSLTAADGIGLSTSPLVIGYAPSLTAMATGTDASIYIDGAGALNATNISALGAISLVASSFNLGTVSGAPITLLSTGNVTFSSLTAQGGDIDVTGAWIDGTSVNANFPALLSTGAITLTSTGADGLNAPSIDVTTAAVAKMFTATAQAGSIVLGTVTSGGTQTIEADQSLTYTTLRAYGIAAAQGVTADAGDIDLTSDTMSIAGLSPSDTLDAHGSFQLIALTTIGGTRLTAETGEGVVTAGGLVTLGTTSVATTLGVTGAGVTLGSATSGGTQTIMADAGAVGFTTLTTTGIMGDTGSIDLTALQGAVAGEPSGTSLIKSNADVTIDGGTVALDTVEAKGAASIIATTVLSGTSLTTGGDASLVAGVKGNVTPTMPVTLAWTNVNAGTTFEAEAYGGTITTLGSATSGGTQTIGATQGVAYTTLLATAGNIGVTGSSIDGGTLTTDLGAVQLTSTGAGDPSIDVTSVSSATTFGATADLGSIAIGTATSGGTQTLTAQGSIDFTTLETTGTGAIDVTSRAGAVAGQGGSSLVQSVADTTISGTSVSLDTVSAVDASISATTSLFGKLLTTTKAASLVAGVSTDLTPTTPVTLAWTNVNAGTTFEAEAYGGTITTLGSATSGGTQTIGATGAVAFTTLLATAGDIGVTGSSIDGGTLTTDLGAVQLTSTGADGTIPSIAVTSVSAGTTFGATARAGGIEIGSATSGGTQTLEAKTALGYTTLQSTGGDIDLTSDTMSIAGLSPSDTLDAHGSFQLIALTTIGGTRLTAETGDGVVTAGGLVTLGTTSVATTLGVTGAGVTLGSATSGGTQTIGATGAVAFTTLLATAGDIGVTSDAGSIAGGSVMADGSADLASFTSNMGNTVTATSGSVTLTAGSLMTPSSSALIDWTTVTAGTTLTATSGGALTLTDAASGTTGLGGTQTLHASGAVTFRTLLATAGDIDVTGSSISGTSTSPAVLALTTNLGAVQLTSTGADGTLPSIDVTSVSTATTFGATAQAGGIAIGTATSGGTQTLEAKTALGYTTLQSTGGDIDLTSDTMSIAGLSPSDTLDAHGSFQLIALTTIGGTRLTAETGEGVVTAGGLVTLGTTSVATTLGVTGAGVTLGSATSGGTQTIMADAGAVGFTTLTTTGIMGDTGSIDLTALQGAVAGEPSGTSLIKSNADVTIDGGTVALDTVEAKGAASIIATTVLSGTSLTTGGDASLVAGVKGNVTPTMPVTLAWTNVNAGTTFEAEAYGGTITTLGSATSGGTQTIGATQGVAYTTLLATAGNIGVTGSSIDGGTLTTDLGAVQLTSTGAGDPSIDVTSVSSATTFGATADLGSIAIGTATSGGTQTLTAQGSIDFTTLETTGTGAIDVTSRAGAVAGQGGSSLVQSVADTTISGTSVSLDTVSAVDASISATTSLFGKLLTTTKAASLVAGVSTDLTPTTPVTLAWTNVNAGTTFEAEAYGGTITTLGSATSGGTQTIGATGAVAFTTLLATAGDIGVTGSSIDGGTLTTDLGAVQLTSTGADGTIPSIAVTSVSAGTTFGATARAGGIEIGSATSGGTQTLEAKTALGYTTLQSTGGDIDLTSDTMSIAGLSPSDTLDAHGSFQLIALTTIGGTRLTAETGDGVVTAGGLVTLGTTSVATTLGVTGAGVTLGSATSGGTQTIGATGAVAFTTLLATAGDIGVTSDAGSIAGGSVMADGSADLAAFTSNMGNTVTATSGSVTLTAGSLMTPSSSALIDWTTGTAGTTLTATSGGALTLTDAASGTTGLGGTQTLHASGAVDLTTVMATAGTLGVTSEAATVTIDAATSDETQTIVASGAVTFRTLTATAGDIDVTGSSISGTSTSPAVLALTTNLGAVQLTSTGADGTLPSIDVTSVSSATTFGATADLGSIAIGTATSGGTQTLTAQGSIDFTTLETTGTGAIDVTSRAGAVAGQGGSSLVQSVADTTISGTSVSLDTVSAVDASISATTSLFGKLLTTTKAASLVAGVSTDLTPTTPVTLAWTNVNAGTTFEAEAYGGTITTLGSATSGGTQTIGATGAVAFTTLLATAGDIGVTSDAGSIAGGSVMADGSADLAAFTSNMGNTVTATSGSVTLTAGSLMTPSSSALIDWTTGTAGTTLTATSGGALTLTDAASGTTGLGGTQTLHASGAVDLTTVMATAGTLGVTSDAATVTIDAATSDETQTIVASGAVTFRTLTATAGDIDVTGSSISGTSTSPAVLALTTDLGAVQLTSTGADGTLPSIDVTSVSTATTFGATADLGSITIGTATSGGTQTLTAQGSIDFTTLETTGTGAIDVTSRAGAVAGQGGSSLVQSVADTTISGTSVSLDTVSAVDASISATTSLFGKLLTTTKAASLVAGVSTDLTPTTPVTLAWTNVNAGTTFEAEAYGGTITTLGSATSGGTQTIGATGAVAFTTLLATAGDIGVTSDAGSIAGGSVMADGSADLAAFMDNTGTTLTTQTGGALLTATTGQVDWQTIFAATTLGATAKAGEIKFGMAMSGGTQTLTASSDIIFSQLMTTGLPNDRGDVVLTAQTGSIQGGDIDAAGFATLTGVGIVFDQIDAVAGIDLASSTGIQGNGFTTLGPVGMTAAGTVALGNVSAGTLTLATPSSITINDLTVVTAVDFAAANVAIDVLRQAPGSQGPLLMNLTGYEGGLGTSATLFVDAPNGLIISKLREDPVTIDTTARQVTIEDAIVTGTMRLTTPDQNLWYNALSSSPVLGNSVQLFSLDDHFYLNQNGNTTTTDNYVVQYGPTSAIQQDVDGTIYYGSSLVRDIDRLARPGDTGLVPSFGDSAPDEDAAEPTLWSFPVEAFDRYLARIRQQIIAPVDAAHAVNLNAQQGRSVALEPFKAVFTPTKRQSRAVGPSQ